MDKIHEDYRIRCERILREFEDLGMTCRTLGKGEYLQPTLDVAKEVYNLLKKAKVSPSQKTGEKGK